MGTGIQLEVKREPLPILVATVAVVSGWREPARAAKRADGRTKPAAALPLLAQCIAQKWANRSQQTVVSQVVIANNQAMDVYVPGQQLRTAQPLCVRPAWAAAARRGSVCARAAAVPAAPRAGDINACLLSRAVGGPASATRMRTKPFVAVTGL